MNSYVSVQGFFFHILKYLSNYVRYLVYLSLFKTTLALCACHSLRILDSESFKRIVRYYDRLQNHWNTEVNSLHLSLSGHAATSYYSCWLNYNIFLCCNKFSVSPARSLFSVVTKDWTQGMV